LAVKHLFTLLYLVFLAAASQAQDSLAIRAYTMGGGSREYGICAARLTNERSVLFNITSNCNTATCNHGMAGIMIDKNGKVIRYKKIGAVTIDIDPNRIIYTSDGHILMVGAYGTPKRLLIKMDTFFNVVWTRAIEQKPYLAYTGPFIESLVEINHNYYMAFSSSLTKVSENGTVVFSKHFGPSLGNTSSYTYVNYNSITPLSANRIFLAGSLKDNAASGSNPGNLGCIIDTNGNIIRQKKFDLGATWGTGITYSFKESANSIKIFGHHNNDLYGANIDTNLTVTNPKKYSGSIMYTHSVAYDGIGRYYISAYNNMETNMSVFALDSMGVVQWSKYLYCGPGYFKTSAHMVDNCTFGVYCSTPIGTSLAHKGYWAKINRNGATANASLEAALSVTTTTSLPITYTPTTVTDSGQWQTVFPPETFISDATVVKDSLWFEIVNPDTCTVTTPPPPPPPSAVMPVNAQPFYPALCSPNPSNGNLHIGNEWGLEGISRLIVYDISGKVIFIENQPASRDIQLPPQAKGVFFVRWEYDGRPHTQRLLVY
jgi:hypothetical protein